MNWFLLFIMFVAVMLALMLTIVGVILIYPKLTQMVDNMINQIMH